jgi:hypothetical protein
MPQQGGSSSLLIYNASFLFLHPAVIAHVPTDGLQVPSQFNAVFYGTGTKPDKGYQLHQHEQENLNLKIADPEIIAQGSPNQADDDNRHIDNHPSVRPADHPEVNNLIAPIDPISPATVSR